MKVVFEKFVAPKPISLSEFAEENGLVMQVVQRDPSLCTPEMGYYANFQNTEVHNGHGILSSVFGNGASPRDAVRSYCVAILGKTLVIDPYTEKLRTIEVPTSLRFCDSDELEMVTP